MVFVWILLDVDPETKFQVQVIYLEVRDRGVKETNKNYFIE